MSAADGRELRARYEPRFGEDGSVDGFYLLAEDVSWRGQTERRYDALLAAADALVVIDASGPAGAWQPGCRGLSASMSMPCQG